MKYGKWVLVMADLWVALTGYQGANAFDGNLVFRMDEKMRGPGSGLGRSLGRAILWEAGGV